MLTKYIKLFLLTMLIFSFSTVYMIQADASTKVMWGKTELKLGQIGKVTINSRTDLYKLEKDNTLIQIRSLKAGDEFRVYSYKSMKGGLYGVGGGSFVSKSSVIKYETPSKSKLALLSVQSTNNPVVESTKPSTSIPISNPTSSIIDRLITLPSNTYDVLEAEKMISRIAKIPNHYLEVLVQKSIELRFINNPLTDEPEYINLRGVTPRGWESGTWDDVPGLGGNPTIARIGYSDFNNGHGSINLELHEIAHAIDIYVFDGISNSDEFKKILDKEMISLMSSHPYPNFIYYLYPEEYFAEAFAYYYLNNERKDELKQRAPLTYSFFQKLEN